MIALLARLGALAGAVAIAAYLASHPGRLSLAWGGTVLDLPLSLAILVLVMAAALLWLLVHLVGRAVRAPGDLARRRRERQRLMGYRSLTDGLVAIAAGDLNAAERHARRAGTLFARGRYSPPPLHRLLSAQAALLRGDAASARPDFAALLDHADTSFLGLRGLIVHALKAGDEASALRLIERAERLQPRAHWVLSTRLALEARADDWRAATATLDRARRAGVIGAAEANRHRVALLIARSRAAVADGRRRDALTHAAASVQHGGSFAPAALNYAARLAEQGMDEKALRVIRRAWARIAHPALVEAYLRLSADAAPVDRLKSAERLVAARPHDADGHLAAASVALAARLWGGARRHLAAAGSDGPGPWSIRLCRLAAELAIAENEDQATAALWRERALGAPPEPAWICADCGAEVPDWRPVCTACGGFDTLAWRLPDRQRAARARADAAYIPALEPPALPASP